MWSRDRHPCFCLCTALSFWAVCSVERGTELEQVKIEEFSSGMTRKLVKRNTGSNTHTPLQASQSSSQPPNCLPSPCHHISITCTFHYSSKDAYPILALQRATSKPKLLVLASDNISLQPSTAQRCSLRSHMTPDQTPKCVRKSKHTSKYSFPTRSLYVLKIS